MRADLPAAARIISSHPQMSDRVVGKTMGLAARTVVAIRRRSTDFGAAVERAGSDGRVRPLDRMKGRRRATALLTEHPGASLREVARGAGISPATVRDVRRRLKRGEEPALAWPGAPVLAIRRKKGAHVPGRRSATGAVSPGCYGEAIAGSVPASQ